MHIFKKALLPLMATAAIVGCSNDNKSIEDVIGAAGTIDTSVPSQPVVKFSPSAGVLPFPSDLLFSGTVDGSINAPIEDEDENPLLNYNKSTAPTGAELIAAGSDMPIAALNTMDGFSTTASIVVSLGAEVDTTNIENGTAVRLFKSANAASADFGSGPCIFLAGVDTANPAYPAVCTGFDKGSKTTWSVDGGELIFGVDFVVSAAADGNDGMSVAILPLKPLDPSSTYMVAVDKTKLPLKSDPSKTIRADLEYRIAQSKYPVLYLTRDLFTELGGDVGMTGIEAALGGLPAGSAAPVFTPFDPTDPASTLQVTDSCVFVKGVADLIDATPTPLPAINFNIDTDCKPTLGAITVLRDNGEPDNSTAFSFESLRIQVNAQEAALSAFTAANPNPSAMALLPVPAFDDKGTLTDATDDVESNFALTFSFSTQNIGSALASAKAQVATTAPTINIHNEISEWGVVMTGTPNGLEVTSPGADGDVNTPADALANVFLGTLENIVQFVDPSDKNGSIWKADASAKLGESAAASPIKALVDGGCLAAFGKDTNDDGIKEAVAGSENLVLCNGFKPKAVSTTHDIPVFISTPNVAAVDAANGNGNCAALNGGPGIPVLIYQHGITTHRGTTMAIADGMAKACVAVVAIDLPKHGILPANDPFGASDLATAYQSFQQLDGVTNPVPERLVQVGAASDCLFEGAEALPGGKFACPSADRYINLQNLPNSRDTFRQGVVDLHSTYLAVTSLTPAAFAADVGVVLDVANVHFLGMSLGAITGAPFVAQESGISTVALNVGSGGIAKVLDGSPSFEPSITAGLAAAGVVKPSASYESFMIVTQTLLDNADPMNMTGQIGMAEDAETFWAGITPSAGAARAVLFQEVVGAAGAADGDGTCNASFEDNVDNSGCPDLTVPNNSFMNSSLATAWGAVSGSGQTGILPGQNPATIPSALSGSDVMAQGTAFLALNTAGALGDPLMATGAPSFYGMALPEIGPAGLGPVAAASGVVRFTAGEHGSLLNPNPGGLSAAAVATSPAFFTTAAMQTQAATFVATGGTVIAGTGTATLSAPLASVIK